MENTAQKGHPKGLYLLFTTEMWERFSYYGMRAIFTLFLTQALLFDKETASGIYGSYTSLVYLTPIIGGYFADNIWGNRKSIMVGGVMMAIGQFFMFLAAWFYENSALSLPLMIVGLTSLIFGNGFFKPNISTLVGQLYSETDKRKDAAYTIFYMGINLGAFIAPLICGGLGERYDADDNAIPYAFKWGFLAACIGMIISVITFQMKKNTLLVSPEGMPIGDIPNRQRLAQEANTKTVKKSKKQLTDDDDDDALELVVDVIADREMMIDNVTDDSSTKADTPKSKKNIYIGVLVGMITLVVLRLYVFTTAEEAMIKMVNNYISAFIFAISLAIPLIIIFDPSLNKVEKQRIGVIYIVAFFVIFFWAAFEQAGASLTFFAAEQTNRNILGFSMPASWFNSFNAVFIVILAPVISVLWTALSKRGLEPASPYKQAYGLFLLALGYVFIAFGVDGVEPGIKVSMVWLTGLYLIHTIGELFLSPIGLSMVNKLAPVRFASLLMGVWFLSTAAANNFAGFLSSFYPEPEVTAAQVRALEEKYSTPEHNAYVLVADKYSDQIVGVEMTEQVKKQAVADTVAVSDTVTISANSGVDVNEVTITVNKAISVALDDVTKDTVEVAQVWVATEKEVEKYKAKGLKYKDVHANVVPMTDADGNETKIPYSAVNFNNLFPKTKDKKKQEEYHKIIQEEKIALAKLAVNKEKEFIGMKIVDLKSFFWLFVYLAGGSSIILFLLSRFLVKMMHGVK
jgi:POT family proton-dependent oligopeptide transporter